MSLTGIIHKLVERLRIDRHKHVVGAPLMYTIVSPPAGLLSPELTDALAAHRMRVATVTIDIVKTQSDREI